MDDEWLKEQLYDKRLNRVIDQTLTNGKVDIESYTQLTPFQKKVWGVTNRAVKRVTTRDYEDD